MKDTNLNIVRDTSECDTYNPGTNRGCTTPKNTSIYTSINTCIDYLKIQFRENLNLGSDFVNGLLEKLLIKRGDFTSEPEKGGYKDFYTFDEDTLIYGNNPNQKTIDNQDVWYLELKGHACRMFELRLINFHNLNMDDHTIDEVVKDGWLNLLKYIEAHKRKQTPVTLIKRIDTTLDDIDGLITRDALKQKFDRHLFTCKLKSRYLEENKEINLYSIEGKGFSIYLGSRESRQLCIYDKTAERRARGCSVSRPFWMRYELRHYNDNAEWAFLEVTRALEHADNFNQIVSELIGGAIEFKQGNKKPEDAKHICRLPIWDKWNQLLSSAKEFKSYKAQTKIEYDITMNKKKEYLASVPYKILTQAFLSCSNEEEFHMFINLMLNKGIQKMTAKDLARVQYQRVACHQKIITMREARDAVDGYVNSNTSFGEVPLYLQELFMNDDEELERIKQDPFCNIELIHNQILTMLMTVELTLSELIKRKVPVQEELNKIKDLKRLYKGGD